jgi:hypothetical protein
VVITPSPQPGAAPPVPVELDVLVVLVVVVVVLLVVVVPPPPVTPLVVVVVLPPPPVRPVGELPPAGWEPEAQARSKDAAAEEKARRVLRRMNDV